MQYAMYIDENFLNFVPFNFEILAVSLAYIKLSLLCIVESKVPVWRKLNILKN